MESFLTTPSGRLLKWARYIENFEARLRLIAVVSAVFIKKEAVSRTVSAGA